jgi:hypothetical protein
MCLRNVIKSTGSMYAFKIFRLHEDGSLGPVFQQAKLDESYAFETWYTARGPFLDWTAYSYGPMFHAFKDVSTTMIILAEIVGTNYWHAAKGEYIIRQVEFRGELATGNFDCWEGVAGRQMRILPDPIYFNPIQLSIFRDEISEKIERALKLGIQRGD